MYKDLTLSKFATKAHHYLYLAMIFTTTCLRCVGKASSGDKSLTRCCRCTHPEIFLAVISIYFCFPRHRYGLPKTPASSDT